MSLGPTNPQIEKIIKRLDLMLHLILKKEAVTNNIEFKQQISDLYNFRVPTQDIANLLGKTRNAIDIQLTKLRKEGRITSQKKNQERIVESLVQINSEKKQNG